MKENLKIERTIESQTLEVCLVGESNIVIERKGNKLNHGGRTFATLEDNFKGKDIKNEIKNYVKLNNRNNLVCIYDKENDIIYYQTYSSDVEGNTFYLYSDYDRFYITCHILPSSRYSCHCVSSNFNDVTEYLLDNFPSQYQQVLFTEDAEAEGIDFYFLYDCIHDETLFELAKSKYFCLL